MSFQLSSSINKIRTIVYCRSKIGSQDELDIQNERVSAYAKANGMTITNTFLDNGEMDALTYSSFRLRAKYREFDVLLIIGLEVLGNSPIEITQEVNFLAENGVKVLSINDGEINSETLPKLFRKNFRFVK